MPKLKSLQSLMLGKLNPWSDYSLWKIWAGLRELGHSPPFKMQFNLTRLPLGTPPLLQRSEIPNSSHCKKLNLCYYKNCIPHWFVTMPLPPPPQKSYFPSWSHSGVEKICTSQEKTAIRRRGLESQLVEESAALRTFWSRLPFISKSL